VGTTRSLISLALGTILLGCLSGCSATVATKPGEPLNPSQSQEPTATPEEVFVFFPNGSASQNLPIFENLLELGGAGTEEFNLYETVSSLVEAGFSLESITHTQLYTGIGEPADSVSLAASFNGECLIGQFSKTWLLTAVAAPTVSGCLVGDFEKAKLKK
jgi:hypothetical protein